MEKIRLIGRKSRLSLLQIDQVAEQIRSAYPGMEVEIIARNSRGDQLADIPLQTQEGVDFFTQDIFDALASQEADIAVHSLKDMSYEHFSGSNHFAVTHREDTRDVVLFNANVEDKIKAGATLVIGTCSPRREEMATGFLRKALPQLSATFRVETQFIRGNVDTRLRKLDEGDYDGIILATAGLIRLLNSKEDATAINALLSNKLLMFLPLIECVPAPCQGAIVAEAHEGNSKAVQVVQSINNPRLYEECRSEKIFAGQFGSGCSQRFGVATIHYNGSTALYAAGKDSAGSDFTQWSRLPQLEGAGKMIFNSADRMGKFFEYRHTDTAPVINQPVVYVANYKVIGSASVVPLLQTKRVWAAGTKTWFELAKKGIWVEGCADALGLASLESLWRTPLAAIDKADVCLLTHSNGIGTWQEQGWAAVSSYELKDRTVPEIARQVAEADIVFWTSFRQYELYKNILKQGVVHAAPSGETTILLQKAGLDPVVFPTIKAFQQWKKTYSPSVNAA